MASTITEENDGIEILGIIVTAAGATGESGQDPWQFYGAALD